MEHSPKILTREKKSHHHHILGDFEFSLMSNKLFPVSQYLVFIKYRILAYFTAFAVLSIFSVSLVQID